MPLLSASTRRGLISRALSDPDAWLSRRIEARCAQSAVWANERDELMAAEASLHGAMVPRATQKDRMWAVIQDAVVVPPARSPVLLRFIAPATALGAIALFLVVAQPEPPGDDGARGVPAEAIEITLSCVDAVTLVPTARVVMGLDRNAAPTLVCPSGGTVVRAARSFRKEPATIRMTVTAAGQPSLWGGRFVLMAQQDRDLVLPALTVSDAAMVVAARIDAPNASSLELFARIELPRP